MVDGNPFLNMCLQSRCHEHTDLDICPCEDCNQPDPADIRMWKDWIGFSGCHHVGHLKGPCVRDPGSHCVHCNAPLCFEHAAIDRDLKRFQSKCHMHSLTDVNCPCPGCSPSVPSQTPVKKVDESWSTFCQRWGKWMSPGHYSKLCNQLNNKECPELQNTLSQVALNVFPKTNSLAQEFAMLCSASVSTMRTTPASALWKVSWKITETLHGEFIKTTLLHSADGKLTGIARSKIRLQHRRRRWNVPLHLEARAIKAQAEISQQFLHQMHNFFRMTPGGLDAVLRESATWPELPDWFRRLG